MCVVRDDSCRVRVSRLVVPSMEAHCCGLLPLVNTRAAVLHVYTREMIEDSVGACKRSINSTYLVRPVQKAIITSLSSVKWRFVCARGTVCRVSRCKIENQVSLAKAHAVLLSNLVMMMAMNKAVPFFRIAHRV